jgi:hypothetical protein
VSSEAIIAISWWLMWRDVDLIVEAEGEDSRVEIGQFKVYYRGSARRSRIHQTITPIRPPK